MDLTNPKYWSERYTLSHEPIKPGWEPPDYDSRILGKALLRSIKKQMPKRIMEMGCGGSRWLPYLAKKTNAFVTGLDYSVLGCKLAKAYLESEGVSGEIHQLDFFKADPRKVGMCDFLFSLGVVEHFNDLTTVLACFLKFLSPGGTLFTEVPNLRSFHGVLGNLWQPKVMAKHNIFTKAQLEKAYINLGLKDVRACHYGLFSLNVIAWGYEPRWPEIEKKLFPAIRRAIRITDVIVTRFQRLEKCIPFFSPFIYVTGEKPLK